jgi:hypothetical protein
MGIKRDKEVRFLFGWQRSLSLLPEGAAIYVVSGCSDRPKEPEAVFTDYAAATLWCARQGKQSINFKVEPFTIYRERGNESTMIKRGINENNHRTRNLSLKPLKSDKEIEAA